MRTTDPAILSAFRQWPRGIRDLHCGKEQFGAKEAYLIEFIQPDRRTSRVEFHRIKEKGAHHNWYFSRDLNGWVVSFHSPDLDAAITLLEGSSEPQSTKHREDNQAPDQPDR